MRQCRSIIEKKLDGAQEAGSSERYKGERGQGLLTSSKSTFDKISKLVSQILNLNYTFPSVSYLSSTIICSFKLECVLSE